MTYKQLYIYIYTCIYTYTYKIDLSNAHVHIEPRAGKRGKERGWAAAVWRVQIERSKMMIVHPSWVMASSAMAASRVGWEVTSGSCEAPPAVSRPQSSDVE